MRKAGLPLIRESIKKQDGNLAKALSTPLPVAAEQSFSILPPGPLSHLGVHPAPSWLPEAPSPLSWLLVRSSQRQISSLLLRSFSLNFLRHLLNALPPPEISHSLLLRESCLRPAVAHVHSAHHLVFPFLQATYCLPDPVVSAEKSALN